MHTTVSLAEPETEPPEQSGRPAARAGDRDRTPSFTYQPALDGLRALAVLGVLLYHAGVSWAPGGFLGVDAFFVLSGFLITSLLVDEWRARGRIDFRAFWARRARRLLPALVLVVIAVGAYAVFVARPDELVRIRGDTLGSLLYVANWRQLFESSYFAKLATPSPLRHTWSLGIEEQWYLVWPLALVLMVRVTAGRRWAIIGLTAALAIGSAALMAVFFHSADPSRVYYGTDTRSQALLVGAVLAFLVTRPRRRRPRQATATASLIALECAGILALVYLGWLWTHVADTTTWLYTGGFLVEGLAVAALIAAATRPYSPILGPLLSLAPLRAIGRISYGVYLWHWPVYVYLTPARTELDDVPLLAVRLAVTFALALVSYRLVEQPIRHGTLTRPHAVALTLFLGVTAAVTLVAVVVSAGGTPSTVSALEHAAGRSSAPAPVTRPQQVVVPRVLIAGDSVALTLGYWLDPKQDTRGVQIRTEATLGCGLTAGTAHSDGNDLATNEECSGWPLRWRKTVDEYQPSVAVVLVGAWDVVDHRIDGNILPVGTDAWVVYMTHQLDTATDVLSARGARVVLLTSPCFGQPDSGLDGIPERSDPARLRAMNDVLRTYAKVHPAKVSLVDLHSFLCPGGSYTPTVDGVHARDPDGTHLSPDGSKLVWRWLARQLRTAGLLRTQ
ncbi:MAG TPA: acyltransferase family protein [Acidimicrobiia bacterium]|nr:acyltransferase family protein [Acidimicrobiia bacterium]